jgi:hypothetical protein
VIFRRNSIGVFRGKDPNSGVQITAQVVGSGCPAPKTIIAATYRGQRALYYLSLQGLAVFNGYTSKLIDETIDIIGLQTTSQIASACAGLYANRYLMLSFRNSEGSQNDTTIVYDTLKDIFVSKDVGYYPSCYFVLGGGNDTGELYFGTSKDLGTLYQFGSGTNDDSPVTVGTDAEVDMSFKIGEQGSGDSTGRSRYRQVLITADTNPGARVTATFETDKGAGSSEHIFSDDRESSHVWGETGLNWDAVMDDQDPPQPDAPAMTAQGFVWGGSAVIRKVFKWILPMSIGSPRSYAIQLDQKNLDKTFNLVEIAVPEKPRTPN